MFGNLIAIVVNSYFNLAIAFYIQSKIESPIIGIENFSYQLAFPLLAIFLSVMTFGCVEVLYIADKHRI